MEEALRTPRFHAIKVLRVGQTMTQFINWLCFQVRGIEQLSYKEK
ncbi:hypothetical protein DNHGIG_15290 [Collibacillus ludicampi]|uniref:Uncharacterized protein n=1 Tax=Collibacillus ludicampi TaxID=2771369 RepID=A0AAV4LDR8_9BACL|nr:hypothetical protein DNHGIG_15290 [Collibacillus ludicampi]